jgi:hypothetical protein
MKEGQARRYIAADNRSTDFSPNNTARTGARTDPTTEKDPLMPQAHTKKTSFLKEDRVAIPRAKGKPMKKARGNRRARQVRIFKAYGQCPKTSRR